MPHQQRMRRRRSSLATVQASLAVTAAMPSSLRRVRWAQVFKMLAMFWTLCYPGISVKLFQVFRCIEIDGEWWLTVDLRLQCFDGQWTGFAEGSAIMLLVYTAGLPLSISVWLWRNRFKLKEPQTEAELGFLCVTALLAPSSPLWVPRPRW